MPKKKSNQSQHEKEKINHAKNRNDFLKYLDVFFKSIAGEGLVHHLSPLLQDVLYKLRPRNVNFYNAPSTQIPANIIKSFNGVFLGFMNSLEINEPAVNRQFRFADYFYFGFAITTFNRWLQDQNGLPKSAEKVKELISKTFMADIEHVYFSILDFFNTDLFPILAPLTNGYTFRYLSYRLDIDKFSKGGQVVFGVEITRLPLEKIHVTIDNKVRPVFRVGLFMDSECTNWFSIKAGKLGLRNVDPEMDIPVYIQNHAVQRLGERIDCIFIGISFHSLCASLMNGKIIRERNDILIELEINFVKVGYLKCIVVENKLIIQTFLFLTCNSTPEGKRLNKVLGLSKADSQYLKIDKLSTFISSKLSSDPEIIKLFEQADCMHLIHLHEKLADALIFQKETSPLEKLGDYLKKSDFNFDDWEDND
jgi:hypothetical protein